MITIKKILRTSTKGIGLLFFLTFLFSFLSIPDPSVKEIKLKIDDCSQLFLNGRSNINSFSCYSLESYPPATVRLASMEGGRRLKFSNALLKIQPNELDCGNKAITKDLCKTLRADEYPFITVELTEVIQTNDCFLSKSCDNWINIFAEAVITITDECQTVNLDVEATKLGEGRYQFVSSKDLLMTDFNIDPPKALLGLIKVKDKITIQFDLVVEVVE